MKVLLFYTSHRQTWELEMSASFLSLTKKLKNICDVAIHCNNNDITTETLQELCDFFCKKSIYRGENTGYKSGLLSAISETFLDLQEYDWVIHLHPDVFIIDDENIFSLLKEHIENDAIKMIVDQSLGSDVFASDFFIFKPKKIPNFFSEFLPDSDPNCVIAEKFLYQKIKKYNIDYLLIDRKGAVNRQIDKFGLLHCHSFYQASLINKAKIIIEIQSYHD